MESMIYCLREEFWRLVEGSENSSTAWTSGLLHGFDYSLWAIYHANHDLYQSGISELHKLCESTFYAALLRRS